MLGTEVGGQGSEVSGRTSASPQACMANGQEAGSVEPTARREFRGQKPGLVKEVVDTLVGLGAGC